MKGEVNTAGWQLLYYIDRGEILQQLMPIIQSTLLTVAVCLLLVVLLINLLSRVLSRRITGLQATAAEIADGRFEAARFTQDIDEIGDLTNSVAEMSRRLVEMIEQVYQMDIDKKSAELDALQAKINPHFLYNCLSGVKWKAIYSGEDEIAETVGQIATFYRTSLNEGQQFTTVENELKNIRSYIEIQRAMHEESFSVEFDISEDGMQEKMLNFLLQPIVENAVEHGLDMQEQEKGGKVVIRYEKQGTILMFQILNSGPPLDIIRLERSMEQPKAGYGLRNIRERIRLFYGDQYGIEAGSQDGLTCFTIKISIIPDTE